MKEVKGNIFNYIGIADAICVTTNGIVKKDGSLVMGAGIAKDSLSSRILWSTERDLRYYLMQTIRAEGTLCPKAKNEWKFIPASWVKKARLRDETILFP